LIKRADGLDDHLTVVGFPVRGLTDELPEADGRPLVLVGVLRRDGIIAHAAGHEIVLGFASVRRRKRHQSSSCMG
jgi:predicted SpoU family rRNA methylase